MAPNIKGKIKTLYRSSWFITLFATTLGVLFALYLDNLSERSKIEHRKQLSFENIDKELSSYRTQLLDSLNNDKLIGFLKAVRRIDYQISNTLITSENSMNVLMRDYSEFIQINDSSLLDSGEYQYDVAYKIEIELDDPQNIAWETSKMSNITQEFNYECLQVLVKIYTLQDTYNMEQQKILNYFVNADHGKLLTALLIEQQLKAQLVVVLEEGQNELENCN